MEKEPEFELVTVAVDELQALVYKKILGEKGIRVRLLDIHDRPIGETLESKPSRSNVKVMAESSFAGEASLLIKNHEDGKITKVFSKSGEHVFIRCPFCLKYLWFPASQKGTSQICPQCLKIIELPE